MSMAHHMRQFICCGLGRESQATGRPWSPLALIIFSPSPLTSQPVQPECRAGSARQAVADALKHIEMLLHPRTTA
jgi:hypothetical protein